MSLEQVILIIVAGAGAIWGLIKFVIPKFVEAHLEKEKDTREHQQKLQQLEQGYLLSEAAVAQQRLAELLQDTQTFVQTTVANSLDKIKTDTSHIPKLVDEIRKLEYEQRNLQTQQRLLNNLVTEIYEHYKKLGGGKND
jgi:hypothetical protein